MAYKASYSASMAAPMNQQAYYSSYGYDQSYGMQDYNQTYEGYSYDYNMAETQEDIMSRPQITVEVRQQEKVLKDTTADPPLVLSFSNLKPATEYWVQLYATDQNNGYASIFNSGKNYMLRNESVIDAPELDTEKKFAIFSNIKVAVASDQPYNLNVMLMQTSPDGTPFTAQMLGGLEISCSMTRSSTRQLSMSSISYSQVNHTNRSKPSGKKA